MPRCSKHELVALCFSVRYTPPKKVKTKPALSPRKNEKKMSCCSVYYEFVVNFVSLVVCPEILEFLSGV